MSPKPKPFDNFDNLHTYKNNQLIVLWICPLCFNIPQNVGTKWATVNQHPPVHHSLDGRYYSLVDEISTELIFDLTLVTNSVT
jgi:hypothetical protein